MVMSQGTSPSKPADHGLIPDQILDILEAWLSRDKTAWPKLIKKMDEKTSTFNK